MKKIIALLCFGLCANPVVIAQKSDSIIVSNAVLHYSVQGEGSPILLLSGGPGISSDQLSDVSERLSKSYRCILFDQRGTGKSQTNPMDSTTINLNQAVNDITSLLKAQNIKKVTIVGHSWGAMLAISYAIKYPDHIAKLILIGPGALELSDYKLIQASIASRATEAQKIFIKQVEDSIANHTASKELMRAYGRTFTQFLFYDTLKMRSLEGRANPSTRDLMISDLFRINYNVKSRIAELDMPLLVVCGRQDPVGTIATPSVEKLNKKAKISWIENCGHFPWLEKPDAFYLELFNFLK